MHWSRLLISEEINKNEFFLENILIIHRANWVLAGRRTISYEISMPTENYIIIIKLYRSKKQ